MDSPSPDAWGVGVPIDVQARLLSVAFQVRLDRLAVACSQVLSQREIPHVLLKGPSTARWLYNPPRRYTDVDLLVPSTLLGDAVAALLLSGVVARSVGHLGELAPHSQLLVAHDGLEVDLHVTLPSVPDSQAHPDVLWHVLSEHQAQLDIDGVLVPVLDLPGRCLVLAMHALDDPSTASGRQAIEDLRRARAVADDATWESALALAARLGLVVHVHAALALIDRGLTVQGTPRPIQIRLAGGSAGAYQLALLADARGRDRWRIVRRELFPSADFVRRSDPRAGGGRTSLLTGYLRRWVKISVASVAAVAELRRDWARGRPPGRKRPAAGLWRL